VGWEVKSKVGVEFHRTTIQEGGEEREKVGRKLTFKGLQIEKEEKKT